MRQPAPARTGHGSAGFGRRIVRVLGGFFRRIASPLRKLRPGAADDATHHNAQALPVLDEEVFRELQESLGNRPEAVQSIYSKFVTSSTTQLRELRELPHAPSARTFHALKGSASMVGASRIAALAERVQHATPELHGSALLAVIGELDRELAEFRRTIEARLAAQ